FRGALLPADEHPTDPRVYGGQQQGQPELIVPDDRRERVAGSTHAQRIRADASRCIGTCPTPPSAVCAPSTTKPNAPNNSTQSSGTSTTQGASPTSPNAASSSRRTPPWPRACRAVHNRPMRN